MSKIKSHKAILKRFNVTGTNKVLRGHAGKNHLLRKKSKKQKRKLSKVIAISSKDNTYIKLLVSN